MSRQNLFLIPGWAVNSSVWFAVTEQLADVFDLHFHDFPGYGNRHNLEGNLSLDQLVSDAIDQSPPNAIWVSWSLGTMVAMEAARQSPAQIAGLVLTCPSPKFMTGNDWEHGQSEPAMDNLADRFQNDYETALKRFLLLQAGTDAQARAFAKETLSEIMQHPQPSWPTLKSGLDLLRQTDLRAVADQINVDTKIIVGKEDRVIPASAGFDLHQRISGSTLIELSSGHAPFFEQPAEFIDAVAQ